MFVSHVPLLSPPPPPPPAADNFLLFESFQVYGTAHYTAMPSSAAADGGATTAAAAAGGGDSSNGNRNNSGLLVVRDALVAVAKGRDRDLFDTVGTSTLDGWDPAEGVEMVFNFLNTCPSATSWLINLATVLEAEKRKKEGSSASQQQRRPQSGTTSEKKKKGEGGGEGAWPRRRVVVVTNVGASNVKASLDQLWCLAEDMPHVSQRLASLWQPPPWSSAAADASHSSYSFSSSRSGGSGSVSGSGGSGSGGDDEDDFNEMLRGTGGGNGNSNGHHLVIMDQPVEHSILVGRITPVKIKLANEALQRGLETVNNNNIYNNRASTQMALLQEVNHSGGDKNNATSLQRETAAAATAANLKWLTQAALELKVHYNSKEDTAELRANVSDVDDDD
jgi:hypothetical protein